MPKTPAIDDFTDFILEISRALIESGCSSNRLETLLQRLGTSFGFEVEANAVPTTVHIAIRGPKERRVELIRVKKWGVDLNKLTELNRITAEIHSGDFNFRAAKAQIRQIAELPPPYPSWIQVLAFGVASSGILYLYKANPIEIGVGAISGILVGLLQVYVMNTEAKRFLSDFLSALIVALFIKCVGSILPGINSPLIIIAGLIVLIPGLVLVNALHELAQKNLVSGTARCFEAFVISLSLAFGVVTALGVFKSLEAVMRRLWTL